MKKRVKLFSTIASLTMALTLFTWGVIAASTVTFKTNSTISFTVSPEVFGIYSASVTRNAEAPDAITATFLNDGTYTDWDIVGADPDLMTATGATLGTGLTLNSIGDTYLFNFYFTNLTSMPVNYTVTVEAPSNALDALSGEAAIEWTNITDLTGTINPGAVKDWQMSVTLNSLNVEENYTGNLTVSIAIEKP